jgi:hypothetical protein
MATILLVFPYRFREFDLDRFEIKCLEKNSNIVIHELIDILHPHFVGAYHQQSDNENILRFASLKEWEREYKNLSLRVKRDLFVINFVSLSGYKGFMVNYFLSRSDATLIRYNAPDASNCTTSFSQKIKGKFFFIKNRGTLLWAWFTFNSYIFRIVGYFLLRDVDYLLSISQNKIKKNTTCIRVNSFDYSSFLRNSHLKKRIIKNNFVVFLDSGGPYFKTDRYLSNSKAAFTSKKWYPQLRSFFKFIEKELSCSVVIAAHPKHIYDEKIKHLLGNREIYSDCTQHLIKDCLGVVTLNSTAVSYAVLYNKPVTVVSSDEIICDANILQCNVETLSNEMGCRLVNINLPFENESYIFNSINKHKYLRYKLKYLSSRKDGKTNCEIIVDEIINHE